MKTGVNKNKELRAPQREKSSKSGLSCGSRASAREAAALRKVAHELPAGTVRSMSIFFRAPNSYPVGTDDVHAVSLGVSRGLEDWT